ncbi:MAG: hypothetical protein AAF741_00795 [Bacteroidota bacterium]
MKIKFYSSLLLALFFTQVYAQRTSLPFELNGRPSNYEIQDSLQLSRSPFARFIGEWTLKEDTWIQNWGGNNDTIKIPHHHTVSSQINTENSLLSIIDGPEPNGHIFWTYNPNTKEIDHLSSFGTIRMGVGEGEFYGQHNVRLKISFEGEAPGTYREYTYEWLSDSEYFMHSKQFDEHGEPTGLFYEGTFVRIDNNENLREKIRAVLDVLDDNDISTREQLAVYADDVIHMAPNNRVISNKEDLLTYLDLQKSYGLADMKHQIVEFSRHDDVIIMRGRVKGVFHPQDGGEAIPFQTKNLFVFEEVEGVLRIQKVIYNASPYDQK